MCFSKLFYKIKEAKEFLDNPIIADKDFIVYKVLNADNHAPYFSKLRYKSGIHYYQDGKRPFGKSIEELSGGCYVYIGRGLHCFSTKNQAEAEQGCFVEDTKVVEMIIPKGAKYYINNDSNEIVTDNLIFPYE